MTQNKGDYTFARRVLWVVFIVVALILVMLFPAIYYSLNTPFALVDDINDSASINILKSFGNFRSWVDVTFIGVSQSGRYRPLFDFQNSVSWLIVGPHPALHHLLRWGEWLTGILFWNVALWRVICVRCYGVSSKIQDATVLISMLIFNVFLCFFPNQPVARLAPQELHTFCALGMLFMGTLRLITDSKKASNTSVTIRTCVITLGFIGLSWAKESNVAFLAIYCLFLFWFSVARSRKYVMVSVLPAAGWLLYTTWRIHLCMSDNYGRSELGVSLLAQNLRWLTNDALQFATSPVFAVVVIASFIAASMRIIRSYCRFGISLDLECLAFSLTMMIGFCAILMISWLPALRYFYPLVPLIGWHLVRGYLDLSRWLILSVTWKRIINIIVIVFLGWFVLANYYGFLLQFAVQHYTRNVEQNLLSNMEHRLKAGQALAICCDLQDPEVELAFSVRGYFDHYLPLYRGECLKLAVLSSLQTNTQVVLASRGKLDCNRWRLLETITYQHSYNFLKAAQRVSAFVQGRSHAYIVQDAGTHDFEYKWCLYESISE